MALLIDLLRLHVFTPFGSQEISLSLGIMRIHMHVNERKSERSRSLAIIGNLGSQDGNAKEDLD